MAPTENQPVSETFRFCPRCTAENPTIGSIPFRCDACGYSNFFGPVGAVAALVVDVENQLLFVRRAREPGKGKWGLPGGFVDQGESLETALAREIREETSLRMTQAAYLMSHPNNYEYRGIVIPTIDLFFVCQVAETSGVTLQRSELEHYEWVRPGETHLNSMAFHSNRVAVEKWLAESA